MKNILMICMLLSFISSNSFALTSEDLQQQGINGIAEFIQYFQETSQLNNDIAEKSLNELNQSIELFKKEGNLKQISFNKIKIGHIFRMLKKFEMAYSYYISALEEASSIENKENQARALLGKARVEILHFHKYGDASKNLNRALKLVENLGIKKLHIELLDFKAQTEIQKADYLSASLILDKALNFYMEAITILEKERATLDTLKTDSFLNDKMDIYYTPLLHLLNLKRKEEAFNLFERSKAKTLLDLISSAKSKNNQELIAFSELMALSAKISSLKKNKEHKELVVLEKKYEKLLFSTNTNRNNLSIAIPSLEKVQKNLEKENYEIIQYLVQKTQLIVWHITKNKIDIKSVYLPQNELSQKVYSIYDTLKIQNGQKIFDEKSAKELFLFLIQPILKDIKSKHLVIVPHYELNHLPFQVLLNPETNQSLGEIFQISYAPSSSILMGLNRIENLKNKKIIAIGNSIMTDGNKEIKSIEKLYPNKVSIFNSITKEKLFKEIKGHNVVHISTHGKYEPTSPMLSYLELKNLNFTASEMFGMPLEKNSLVVLSACETGKVQFTQSNETLGMVRALLYAGADSLLLSSWKVDEQITALWMENFYKFARTETLVESARLALIEIKKKHPHPHYWAGFSMIGK